MNELNTTNLPLNKYEQLCENGFSEETFLGLVRQKWGSFAPVERGLGNVSAADNFENPRLVGVVKNLPKDKMNPQNYPLVVVFAKLPRGKELGERSSRKKQFEFAKKTISIFSENPSLEASGIFSSGLFVFFDGAGNFRVSLITSSIEKKATGGYTVVWNSFRRQSFYIQVGKINRTFCTRFGELPAGTLSDLQTIFSVEALTKEFYAEIENWFLWAKTKVEFPGAETLGISQEEHNSTSVLRLITRLIFIWFLKQKGLVPAELFDKAKIGELLRTNADSRGSTYYKAILQNLFFATLNTKIGERAWVKRQTGKQEFFRYQRFFKTEQKFKYLVEICGKVPFVNGGLFENLDRKEDDGTIERIDCFSNAKANEGVLCVPDELFWDSTGILAILARFDFTIEENAPADEDVSLDPELLGRVFENLLAYVNPETQEQARKSSGSFYTPREIVAYMVDEALKQVIGKKEDSGDFEDHKDNGNETTAAAKVSKVPSVPDLKKFPAVAKKLLSMKVLDPACGSGAFPMGILARTMELLEECGAVNADDAEAVYKTKLAIIQNCIYGVDIQNIAVQITKLRFFISLLCEQKTNNDPAQNYGIKVLPNLETKIVCANTLLGLPGEYKDEIALFKTKEIEVLRESLNESRRKYFSASEKTQKAQLRKEDTVLREQLRKELGKSITNASAQDLETAKTELGMLLKERERLEKPDWKKLQPSKEQLDLFESSCERKAQQELRYDANVEKRAKSDKAIAKQKNKIATLEKNPPKNIDRQLKAVNLIANWNPYDPNTSAPFFDPVWMFGFDKPDTFDVVIGNPPYGAKVSEKEKKYYKENYACAKTQNGLKGSTDTFAVFVEKGHDLVRQNGFLTFIVPMSITSSDAMTALHAKIESDCGEIGAISFSNRPMQIFDAACIRTSIIMLKRDCRHLDKLLTTKMIRRTNKDTITSLLGSLTFANSLSIKTEGRYPKIGSEIEVNLLRRCLSSGFTIASYKQDIGGGIYYRTSGGRYFNIITNYSTGSTKERAYPCKFASAIGAILSSSVFYFYQQAYTNGLDLKQSEIEKFPLPDLEKIEKSKLAVLEKLYEKYLKDIEQKANVRAVAENSRLKVKSFKEYKIVRSIEIIREIDSAVCELYGLSKEESDFIKSYEMEYRMAGDNGDKNGDFGDNEDNGDEKLVAKVPRVPTLTSVPKRASGKAAKTPPRPVGYHPELDGEDEA